MSLATFGDLKTAIATWLNRTNFSDAQLAEFVQLAEADIRNDVECRESEQRATGTMTGDGFTAPSGFLVCRTLVVEGTFHHYLPPEQYTNAVENDAESGYYTINGDVFSVIGGDGQDFELLYQATITALAADGDTNWILTNAPSVYLWGGCKYASMFMKDTNAATSYGVLYETAVNDLNTLERKSKVGGPLVVRTDTTTP